MNKQELKAFAKHAAKGIKSEVDLNDFNMLLLFVTHQYFYLVNRLKLACYERYY